MDHPTSTTIDQPMYEPSPATRAGDGLRLLIADDNRDAAESLALLLQLDGHVVHIAYDGREALRMAQSLLPDVTVLDIGMPGLDGHAVARGLRESLDGQRMLILAVSGRAGNEDIARAHAAGFDRYFTKPVPLGELMRCIAQWRADGAT